MSRFISSTDVLVNKKVLLCFKRICNLGRIRFPTTAVVCMDTQQLAATTGQTNKEVFHEVKSLKTQFFMTMV